MPYKQNLGIKAAIAVSLVSVAIPAIANAQPGILSTPTAAFSPTNFAVLAQAASPQGLQAWQRHLPDWLGTRAEATPRRPRKLTAHRQAAGSGGGSGVATVVRSSGKADWYAIAACESGGRWNLNSGNGFWGGLQFLPSTWFAYGGGPFDGVGPFPYSSGTQIAVAERVLAGQGPGAWPNCFRWA